MKPGGGNLRSQIYTEIKRRCYLDPSVWKTVGGKM